MGVDTKTMREQIEAAAGDRVQVDKADMLYLIDVVENGQTATEKLAGIRFTLQSLAMAA